MKFAMREYIDLSNKEKMKIWKDAVFVFDTNILLNAYRYSNGVRDEIFAAMEDNAKKIMMPHQVALEFFENRISILYKTVDRYKECEDSIKDAVIKVSKQLNIDGDDEFTEEIMEFVESKIDEKKEQDLLVLSHSEDPILDRLLDIFSECTREEYDSDTKKKIYEEGEDRYFREIPPGYKDISKDSDKKKSFKRFGDLVIWNEIIDYAKSNETDIIFVTDDDKEDWWYIIHGKTIGPRPELRKEFYDKTKREILFYNMERFLAFNYEHKGSELPKNIENEIVNIRNQIIHDRDKSNLKEYSNMNKLLYIFLNNLNSNNSNDKYFEDELSIENHLKLRYYLKNMKEQYIEEYKMLVNEMVYNDTLKHFSDLDNDDSVDDDD